MKNKKSIAVLQSNYIPWKGYFDIIAQAHILVIYDTVQYTTRDWRNRNRIKTPNGLRWLTVPIKKKGFQSINEVQVESTDWCRKHWQTLTRCYSRASPFKDYRNELEHIYLEQLPRLNLLTDINTLLIKYICDIIGITTAIKRAEDFVLEGDKNDRLLSLCRQTDSNLYLSGQKGRNYLDVERFESQGITVQWMDYSGYPSYKQRFGKFEHSVTILDLLFNTGPAAPEYMKIKKQIFSS
jgi:hypothetical protein